MPPAPPFGVLHFGPFALSWVRARGGFIVWEWASPRTGASWRIRPATC
jgi:hypothetical protein